MIITIEEIQDINKQFDTGEIVNRSSLEFALSAVQKSKDWITQVAYLLRTIALDHVFREGNKRTAVAVFIGFCNMKNKSYDIYKVDQVVKNIIQKNITDIQHIRRLIKNATV